MLFSFQLKAEDERKYAAISNILTDVSDVNQTIIELEDDKKLSRLILEKNNLFANLLLIIRGSFVDYDVELINKEELQLLQSKININRARGNVVAVQRDQFDVAFYLSKRDIGRFVVYLIEASRDYQSKGHIIEYTEQKIDKIKRKIKGYFLTWFNTLNCLFER